MISQLDDAERAGVTGHPQEMASSMSRSTPVPVPWAQPANAPPRAFAFEALPAMTRGLCALAAIWVGLALFVSAFAFYAETNAEVLIALIGAWLFAAGTAYVIADAPSLQPQGGVA